MHLTLSPATSGFLDVAAARQGQTAIDEQLRAAIWAPYNASALRKLEQMLTGTPGSLAPVADPTDAEQVVTAIEQFQEAVNEQLFPITTGWYVEIGEDYPTPALVWLVPDVYGVEHDATFTAGETGAFDEFGIIDCLMALAESIVT